MTDKQHIEVGVGATQVLFTDTNPYTVIKVSENGKTLWLQADEAIRVGSGPVPMGTTLEYTYKPDPKGHVVEVTLRKSGRWHEAGSADSHNSVHYRIGARRKYRDASF
jgi:hypothetical protein